MSSLFSAAIVMVTTVMTPIALKLMYRFRIGADEPVTEPVSVALPEALPG